MRDEHTKGRREGGANTEDWQKQSSSTVWCLNLHCLRYTPVTHHRSTLMTSNLTQGFGIGPAATPALVSGMRVILIRCILQLYLQEVMMCCGQLPWLRGNTRPARQLHSFWNFHEQEVFGRQILSFYLTILLIHSCYCLYFVQRSINAELHLENRKPLV